MRGLGLTMTQNLVILSVPNRNTNQFNRNQFRKGDRIVALNVNAREWKLSEPIRLEKTLRLIRDSGEEWLIVSVARGAQPNTTITHTFDVTLLNFTDPPRAP